MSPSEDIIFFFVIVFIVGVGEILTISNHKNMIRESLETKKAKVIKIAWQPLDFDRDNHTYSVEYIDLEGRRRYGRCKIHFLGSSIYWEE